MATPQTEAPRPITISTNCIVNGKFYTVGDVLPFERIQDLPETLRPLVVLTDAEPEEENTARGSFDLNTPYETTPDGRLGRALKRKVEREIAELESENAREEWIEEEAANAELPPDVARDLQEAHESHVALQAAQMGAAARRADAASDAAAEATEPPRLYVKRGGRHYAPADKEAEKRKAAKLRKERKGGVRKSAKPAAD